MTVCIAAMCEEGKKLIAASDHMVTFGNFSADSLALKADPIHRDWHALFAGDDIGHVRPILSHVKYVLHARPQDRKPKTDGEIRFVMELAYRSRLHCLIEVGPLAPYNVTVDEFYKNGKKKFTAAVYDRLCAKIEAINVGCHFLVCGFDPQGEGHILYLDDEGVSRSCDPVGFWAIGSGAHPAMSSLAFHADKTGFNQSTGLAVALYHVCEAKFMAESSKLVGRETFVAVYEYMQPIKYLPPEGIAEIRTAWEKSGAPRVPKKILSEIEDLLVTGPFVADS